tara:strand:- start:43190 stop:44788 length:1599 start_codon:yes stop_codon:yes gene_type:complete
MDQVKTFFAAAMKHGFWIGSGAIFIGSLAVWFLSTSSLKEELESRTSKINGDVSKVSQTRNEVPTAPNPISHAEMERLIEARTDEVVDAWTRMYDRQRRILTWPRKELRDDFVAEFENKIPIEEYVAFPTLEQDEVDPSIRTRYQFYIDQILPGLAEIGGAKWTASFDSSGLNKFNELAEGGIGRPEVNVTGIEEDVPLVHWGSGSQSAVLSDLFPWRGSRPTTLEVYYSQENIWILKQLLQIVADVNGEAELPFQAKIREIRQFAIGSSADFEQGEIMKPGELPSAMGGGGGDEFMDDEGDYEEDEGEYDDGGGDFGSYGVSADPGDNRYVNLKLEPITGAQLRSALESKTPEDANIAVAKRVPVMMSFQMDQRAVPDLIAACGSAELMVEVRQVRILPDEGVGFSAGSAGGGYDEDEGDMDEGDDGTGGGYMPMTIKTTPEKEFPFDMSVEVYGLIYIYNPPQKEKLGVDQVDQNTVIDGVPVLDDGSGQDALPAPGALPITTETPAEEAAPVEATDPAATTPPTAIATP